jgi:hypothetical protein
MAWKHNLTVPNWNVEVQDLYSRVNLFQIDYINKTIQIAFGVYKTAADAADPVKSRQPLQVIPAVIGPHRTVIQAEVKHPVTKEVLIPEVTIPSFDEVIAANQEVYAATVTAIYELSVLLKEFQSAVKV